MAIDDNFSEYLQELLEWLPRLRRKRMFGGLGFYSNELFFAIANDAGLYIKADTESAPLYKDNGAEPFTYAAKGNLVQLNYWSVPIEILEEAEALRRWVCIALDTAHRAKH
jgi:DNA transformation protein and related proteins